MCPEFLAGVFEKDVAEVVLGVTAAHEGGEWGCFASVVHVAIDDEASVGIFCEDGITVLFCEASFVEADFSFVEVTNSSFRFEVKANEMSWAIR